MIKRFFSVTSTNRQTKNRALSPRAVKASGLAIQYGLYFEPVITMLVLKEDQYKYRLYQGPGPSNIIVEGTIQEIEDCLDRLKKIKTFL
jgi:hypothetical protein